MTQSQRSAPLGTVRILRPYMRREWPALGVAGVSTFILTAAALAEPWPLKYALDNVIFETDGDTVRIQPLGAGDVMLLVFLAAAVFGIGVVGAIATYQAGLRLMLAGERIIHELRLAVYAQLQRLRISFHHRTPTGDLVTRVTADADAIGEMFADNIGSFLSSALLLIGMLVVSFVIDPFLALIFLFVAPLLAIFSSWFRRRQRAASKKQRSKEGEVASLSGEVLAAMREVQAFGSEEYEQARLRAKSEERWRAGIASARLEAGFSGAIDVTGALGVALVLAVGVWRVRGGHMTPGELTIMVAYATKLYKPLSSMAKHASRISKALARGDRIADVLATDELLEERPNAYQGGRATGEIQFDRVVFGYTPDRIALDGVSFIVPAGQRVAIIGRSGAGKSTVAALISRFYDPEEGRVLIDGRDVRDCSLSWLRTQVGLVLQESVLFTGTVAENIAYGIGHASRDAVIEAAKAAGAHDFVSQLPDGYDTMLGQRGVGLSGGQRQRIAIARMILRDPAILLLDEPTTGLDVQSEAEVMHGLETLMRGRTTIIITHSPALARTANRVIEIADRGIARQGTPGELAADLRNIRRAEGEKLATSRRVAPPPDAALPQLEQLLDPEQIAPALRRSLGWDAPLPDVRIRYVRYRPRRNLVAHYEVALGNSRHDAVAIIAADRDLARWVADPAYRQLAELVDGRAPARDPLGYDAELGAMIQWLPLDISLPALAEEPLQLRLRLQEAGVAIAADGDSPELLGYRPRRRAVLRLDGHVVKVFAERSDFEAAVAAREATRAVESVYVSRSEGAIESLHLTCERFVRGSEPGPEAADVAGATLAALHASRLEGLRTFTAVDQLKAAAAAVDDITALVPELEARLQNLLQTLELTRPDLEELVSAHGNFHPRQLLVVDGTMTVLDFDHVRAAPAALDVSTYVARLIDGSERDMEVAAEALARIAEGYGRRPRALSWYLATSIVRRAPMTFRLLVPEWPLRIEKMIVEAEDALHL